MVGDAPGDLKAARDNGALFYPINPGDEEASWERFYNEAMQRFFDGTYAGAYEAALIVEFDRRLPDTPPWNALEENHFMPQKIVTFGEIMLRLSPPGYQRFGQARAFDVTFGGGEANVAYRWQISGCPSIT
jgi:hypothetical protein